MRLIRRILLVLLVVGTGVYLFNASWRVAPREGAELRLIAHRGVHQTYDNNGLGKDGCSAERIYPPTHIYQENTLASMEAAFSAGADVVEFDIHPTTEGQLAVLHDWTIDCRTEGSGVTREQNLAYLKTLDVAYGYTADGGQTFPFRGQGVGLMPEFGEVLEAFPDRQFLVNFKSNEAREGDMLAARLEEHPQWRPAVWGVYGGDPPTFRAAELLPGVANWSRRSMINCLLQYEGVGWTGWMPSSCRDTVVLVPINFASFLWGWPNLFLQRMRDAGTTVILIGPYDSGDAGTSGIDTAEQLAQVPLDFDGYIWTNRIEVIGPLLGRGTFDAAAEAARLSSPGTL